MGTNSIKLEKYLGLWDLFEKTLKKEGLTLASFSKKWIEYDGISEESKYNIYDKLKKQKQRKNNKKSVQDKSITSLEKYIKFLDKDFTAETMRNDESYGHWFD